MINVRNCMTDSFHKCKIPAQNKMLVYKYAEKECFVP